MALSRLAPAVTAGLMACSGADINLIADNGYGFCRVAKDTTADPYYGDTEFVDAPFGTIFAESPVAVAGSMLPPETTAKIEALKGEFIREASRQVELVREAGGYCNLPKQPANITADECENCWADPDDRLGDALTDIIGQRDAAIDAVVTDPSGPAWPGQLDWRVELGRSECDFMNEFSLDDFEYGSDAIWALPPEDLQTLQDRLSQQIGEWNDVCAEAQGGLFSGRLHEDSFAGAQILVERGRALSDAIGERAADLLFAEWRELFRGYAFIGATAHTDLSPTDLEREQFLGSYWFAEKVLGGSHAYWRCPVFDDHVADGGFERNARAGIIYDCLPDSELTSVAQNGVKIPLSAYENSVDGM